MASPRLPTSVIAAVAGLSAFILYRMVKAAGPSANTQGGVRYWNASETGALRALLEQSVVTPTIDQTSIPPAPIPRVMTVQASGTAAGENALAWVKKVQAGGHLVTASDNVLDKSAAKRLLADILPAEQAKLAGQVGLAVLPTL